jgi:multidrug efflux pump subunit AcrA (membrane-fusion protein)
MAMALASTIIGAVGDLLVLIALIVAVKALNTANSTRAEALTTDQTASKARLQAANREIESVRLASESLKQAQAAAREADQREREAAERSEAVAIAAAERDQATTERATAYAQEAFLERQYERVLTVGQLVEDMFWAIQTFREKGTEAADVPKEIWMPLRNGLRHRLVGLKEALPSCQRIIDAGTAYQAFDGCVLSRNEVEVELQRIDRALDDLHAAFRVRPHTQSPR